MARRWPLSASSSSIPTLDIFVYGYVLSPAMARAATTTDAFNAIAEPRRREILDLLVEGERSVGDLVESMPISQPQVSKHLNVLKEVGLVCSRPAGRQRMYRIQADALRPIHDWLKDYERLWNQRLDRLDGYLGEIQGKERP